MPARYDCSVTDGDGPLAVRPGIWAGWKNCQKKGYGAPTESHFRSPAPWPQASGAGEPFPRFHWGLAESRRIIEGSVAEWNGSIGAALAGLGAAIRMLRPTASWASTHSRIPERLGKRSLPVMAISSPAQRSAINTCTTARRDAGLTVSVLILPSRYSHSTVVFFGACSLNETLQRFGQAGNK
jgi:hypothetical protein